MRQDCLSNEPCSWSFHCNTLPDESGLPRHVEGGADCMSRVESSKSEGMMASSIAAAKQVLSYLDRGLVCVAKAILAVHKICKHRLGEAL